MEKKIYVAPEVEVIEVKIEQGFAQTEIPVGASTENMLDGGVVEW